jgi:hypothetical protein
MEAPERVIRTYVLRLLVDRDEPDALRGFIHSVASGEQHSFADKSALLTLLRQMVWEDPASGDGPPDEAVDHPERSKP